MAIVIYRGSTPTIYISPSNGMSVSDLGEPTVAISQDIAFLTPDVEVDTTNNRLIVSLDEEDTLSLTEGVETYIQAVYEGTNGNIIRFPMHPVTVVGTLIEEVTTPEELE